MLKQSKSQSKKPQQLNNMSREAQTLYEKLLKISKTTKTKPKLISYNDVYQFVDLKKDKK